MNDLKEIKQAIVSYALHFSFVREVVKMWTSSKKAIPQNWLQLVSEVLEDRTKLLWKCYWQKRQNFQNKREKRKNLKLPKSKFLARAITRIHRIGIYMMKTVCPYATQQP